MTVPQILALRVQEFNVYIECKYLNYVLSGIVKTLQKTIQHILSTSLDIGRLYIPTNRYP